MSPPPAWEAVPGTEGVWTCLEQARSGWSWRMVAVTLPGGGLALVSPVRRAVAATEAWLREHGGVRFVLSPNHFHHLGIPETLAAFPEARVVASPVAVPRLTGKLGRPVEPLDDLAAALPAPVTLLEPAGLKCGETWLRLEMPEGVAWVVSDAYFHVPAPLRGGAGVALRLAGAGPGLRIGTTFKVMGVARRAEYRAWLLGRLAADRPRVLIPAHGERLAAADLADRLEALAHRRL